VAPDGQDGAVEPHHRQRGQVHPAGVSFIQLDQFPVQLQSDGHDYGLSPGGILLSTSFLTADTELGIDNNFSGTTVVRNNTLVRCGGWDHTWTWRAALQICMERKSISGLHIEGIEIRDSFSDGVGVVAPGSAQGNGTLSHTRLVNVSVSGVGLGSKEGRGFFIREDARGGLSIEDCEFPSILNASASFTIRQE